MSDANDLEADLVIALQTLDTNSFRKVLQNSTLEITSLQDQNKTNIFHEFAKSIIKESLLIEFLEIIISFFYRRYSEKAPENIKYMMNTQTIDEEVTPLHIAVETGKLVRNMQKLVKEYIRMGSNLEIKTGKKQNIVHLACINGSMTTLAYLKYEVGIEINDVDRNMKNPLHVACSSGNIYIVQCLIAWGININSADDQGNTALHYAAINGNYRVVRALLIAGAERSSLNSAGENPFALAKKEGNADVLKILVFFN